MDERADSAARPRTTAMRLTGVLIAAVALLALPFLYRAELRQELAFRIVFLSNLGALLAASVGLLLATRRRDSVGNGGPWARDVVVIVALTVVGAAMRLLQWGVFPPADGQLLEEPQVAYNALRSIRWGHIDAYFPIANLLGEAGFRVIGPTVNGMRIPFVTAGILSVPAFYVCARLFLRTFPAALFVGVLFATNSMLAGSSRIAIETMHPVFTLCVALAAVFWAGRRPTAGRCALAGLLNAILLAEYDSYRLTAVLNSCYLTLRLTLDWRAGRASWPRQVGALVVFSLFVIGAELPRTLADTHHPLVYLTGAYDRHRSYLDEHRPKLDMTEVLAEEAAKLRQNLGHVFLYGDSPDVLPISMGHFDPFTGMLGVVALIFCVTGARAAPIRLFPVFAVVLLVTLSSVLVGNVGRYRLFPVIPYYLLAIGLLVDEVTRRLESSRAVLLPGLALVAIFLSGLNAYRFFGVAIHDRTVQEYCYDLSMILSREIATIQHREPGARIVVLSDQTHLGVPNDYAFRYEPDTVDVYAEPGPAHDVTGYLLAHDGFIPLPGDLPGMRDCVRWKTRFDRNEVLRCRLEAHGAPGFTPGHPPGPVQSGPATR